MNFLCKPNEGKAESIDLFIFVLWQCFNRRRVKGRWVEQKVLIRASWNRFFFQQNFSRSIRHETFWHAVSTGYFNVFLLTISVSDFRLLEIYKNLGFPLFTVTFTVNSHADNHLQKQLSWDVLRERCSEICRKFASEHPCWSVISIKLQSNFIETRLRHGCSPVNLLYILEHIFLKGVIHGTICMIRFAWFD